MAIDISKIKTNMRETLGRINASEGIPLEVFAGGYYFEMAQALEPLLSNDPAFPFKEAHILYESNKDIRVFIRENGLELRNVKDGKNYILGCITFADKDDDIKRIREDYTRRGKNVPVIKIDALIEEILDYVVRVASGEISYDSISSDFIINAINDYFSDGRNDSKLENYGKLAIGLSISGGGSLKGNTTLGQEVFRSSVWNIAGAVIDGIEKRIEEMKKKQIGQISVVRDVDEPADSNLNAGGSTGIRARVNTQIPENTRMKEIEKIRPVNRIYDVICHKKGRRTSEYGICYEYEPDQNGNIVCVYDPNNGTSHSRIFVIGSDEVKKAEDISTIIEEMLSKSYDEFRNAGGVCVFHTTIDKFIDTVKYYVTGDGPKGKSSFYRDNRRALFSKVISRDVRDD